MTTSIITDRLVPTREVARRLGMVAVDIERGAYGVRVVTDWAGRPCITETDAARLLEDQRANLEANRRRKAEQAARQARDDQLFEDDRDRRFFTAYAAVLEHGGPYGDRDAPGVAFAVISSDDPENELQRVITRYGEPDVRSIMYVKGTNRRPKWLH